MRVDRIDQQFLNDSYMLRGGIDHLPHYVFWKDANLVFRGCNKRFAQQFGYQHVTDIVGKIDADFNWPPYLYKKYADDDREILRTGVAKLNYEEEQKQIDGSIKTVLASKVPIYDNAKIVGILGVYTDITERKKFEFGLQTAKEQAEVANEAKTQFIANMEHDLRTPCSGVAEATKLLAAREDNPEKKKILEYVAKASARLLEILNGILTFDQIESGILPIVDKQFDVRKTLEDTIDLEMPSAEVKHLKLIANCAPDVPRTLVGDEHRISRMLLNLVSNAIKFTSKGYVEVAIKVGKVVDARNIIVQFIVKDTGMGIPEDKQQIIYERFTRMIPTSQDLCHGSGLGLSIVKKFINELDGDIEVDSAPGRGSTFTCTMPFKTPLLDIDTVKQQKPVVKAFKKNSNMRILIVEDDALAAKIAAIILEEQVTDKIDIATNGKKALSKACRRKYDLILMDLGLPDMTGYDIATKIRTSANSKNRKIPIVAVTAHSISVSQSNARDCIDDYITKPLNKSKIHDILHNWCVPGYAF